jgi:hypothetical protein
MRTSLVTIALASALAGVVPLLSSGTPAEAQGRVYPYCLVAYSSLTTPSYQCGYTSFEQCMAAASGLSARCYENPELQAKAQSRTRPAKSR